MYDVLLALHLLSAAIVFVTIAFFSAWAVGAPLLRDHFRIADQAWNVSGGGLVIFGIWLALYVDGYEIWDGWIIATLILFGAASAFGAKARDGVVTALDAGGAVIGDAARWHWLRTAAIVAILVLMVYKPGA